MKSVAEVSIEDGIGILTIDSPPVNALGIAVRRGLRDGLKTLTSHPAVRAIVLICDGRTFFAGADVAEFGRPKEEPLLVEIFDIIENSEKPVIAAMHGTALGGGLELALTCHYRIAVLSAKVGLPEVKLGLLPGAGGTQRLPRLVGAEVALDLISSGRSVDAAEALNLRIVDRLAVEGHLRPYAIAFARYVLAEGRPLQRIRDRQDAIAPARGKPEIFSEFRKKNFRMFRGFKAPEYIVRAIEAAVELPFEQGLEREAELFQEVVNSVESAALRYIFFAERKTSKVPDLSPSILATSIASVAVIGAGTMGGGITMNMLNVGIPVTLIETSQAALDRGIATIRRNYENSARKGRMTTAQVERRMDLITPALELEAACAADLVIEAVFESMQVKKDLFARLDRIAKAEAILASNTSFLDLDQIAAATTRPERVIGMHFFSPANVMRLLEIVRGKHTSGNVVATAMKVAKKIGKVPVLSRVCDGFIANRLMSPRMKQAERLILEGPTPADIDRVMYEYGFAMGPFQMIDLVGLDVIGRDSSARTLRGDLVSAGRLGQKSQGGFYDYDEHRAHTPSSVAAAIIADFAEFSGVENAGPQSDAEILAHLLYPVVNEGARILQEGIALRASDIDVAAILGYNWPTYTGGPMFWADTVGLPKLVNKLRQLEAKYGAAFEPAALLVQLAEEGKSFVRR